MDPAGKGILAGEALGTGLGEGRPPFFLFHTEFSGTALGGTLGGLYTGQPDHLLPLQGKVFPKLRKRSSIRSIDVEEPGVGRATDYVFRIIYPGHRHEHSECPHIPCEGCSGVRALL